MLDRLARRVWYAALWLSRRRPAKRLQRLSVELAPRPLRTKAEASLRRQNAWARRHGLNVVRLSLSLVALSAAFWAIWLLLAIAADRGWLARPASPDDLQRLELRLGQSGP
ncbi:MAG: hypothetical protein N2109_03290 [Fimbriimonadales bacterium]|nr:hypothetical protein [Fimbriimonadales bacterium]